MGQAVGKTDDLHSCVKKGKK